MMRNRRGLLKWMAGVCVWPLLTACERNLSGQNEGQMKKEKQHVRYFDVATYSYIERPIFDIYANGRLIGAAGGGGVIVGVPMTLGPQLVTWRLDGPEGTPRNGETVTAKNQPVLADVDSEFRYLGIHIYPDETVELVPEMYWPERTEKGKRIMDAWGKKNGAE